MENFNQVYADNHKAVFNHIKNSIHDNYTIAEELTNDVFMAVHKHLPNYDSTKASVKTWVMAFAKNKVIDHYRKKKAYVISLDKNSDNESDNVGVRMMDSLKTSSKNPHQEMVGNEIMDIVQDEINSLKGVYRDVADLFFNEDLSYEEISDRLKLPLGTIKGQISRARKKLQPKLETVRS